MSTVDVLSWMMGGLVAGILAGALRPRGNPGERIALAAVGLLGASAGGAAIASFTDMNAVAFLGAVCAAVMSSVALAYLLWRTRYHD